MSTASDISHNNLLSSRVKSHWTQAEWEALFLKKNNNSAADSHPLCGHFGEAQHAAPRNSYDRLSLCDCQLGVMHLWITCFSHDAGWMGECVEILDLAGGWHEKIWSHHQQDNYTPSSSLIWSWDQHLVSKKETQTLVKWIMGIKKSLFRQNHKFLDGKAKVLVGEQTWWLIPQ